MVVIPLRKDVRMQCGSKYELVSVKVGENTVRGGVGTFDSPKLAKLMYMKTEGSGIQSMSLSDFLLRLGDFSRLSPRKVMSRLELLQSPANHEVIFTVKESDVGEMVDGGTCQGCRFISDEMMIKRF